MKGTFIHIKKFIRLQGIIALVFFSMEGVCQQNVQFTQYMFNGLVINPAYAGAEEALSLTLIHRAQWVGVEGAPTTQTLSAHTLYKKKQIGLGIVLVNDKIGVHSNINLMTNYAYHLKVSSRSTFSFGLKAGLINRRSDYASVSSNDDVITNNAEISSTFFDVGFGIYFRAPKLHLGFSMPKMIADNMQINDTLTAHFSGVNSLLFFKYTVPLNEEVNMEPGFLIKYFHGVPLSFDINMNFVYRKILTAGLSYRKSESIDFLFKGKITPQLQIGYSYDYSIGHISLLSNASHEILVNYIFRYEQKDITSPR